MQPVRLGAQAAFLACAALFSTLTLSPPAFSQGTLETPQQTNERIRQLSTLAQSVRRDYLIGSGDLLSIEVFDVPELSREVRVSEGGTISLPLLPVRLQVAGLTELQLEQKVGEVLAANGLVTSPQVRVAVKERKSKPITVIGAVGHPIVYHPQPDRVRRAARHRADINQQLPDDFQRAEFLLAHGLIDMIVERKNLKKTISTILTHLAVAQ